MLNRNDRIALKRNRNAVSWLCVLCLALLLWIKMLYGDVESFSNNNNSIRYELDSAMKLSEIRKNKIDSLMSVINYKQVDTPKVEIKPYKIVKKDSLTITKQRVDSVKPDKKDTILKDSLSSK
jgi:hypothetical protein